MSIKDGANAVKGSGPTSQDQGGSQWADTAASIMDAAATLIPLIKTDSQRAQIKKRIKLECGPKPLLNGQRKKEHAQCQIRVMNAIRNELTQNVADTPATPRQGQSKEKNSSNTALFIIGGVAIVGILSYFVYRKLKNA